MTDPHPPAKRPRVFVIDDDRFVIEMLMLRLGTHYDVGGTTSPAEAVDQASRFGADLVLCDISMPGMSGDRVARALRRDPRTAALPIVYFTGMLPAGETSAAMEGAFGGHLAVSKSASVDALLRLVQEALEKAT